MRNRYKKPNVINIIVGIVFLVLFVLTYKLYMNKWTDNRALIVQFITIAELFIALFNFLPIKIKTGKVERARKKYSTANIVAMIFVVIAVPLTVFFGTHIFTNLNFYFVILLVVLELLVPFVLSFGHSNTIIYDLVVISVLCALAIAGRIVFASIPQFKPIVAIVIVSGVVLGAEKGFMIGALSAFVSNVYFGQGSWTPWQMLAIGAMGFFSGIIFNMGWIKKDKIPICIFGGIATVLVYGGIVNFQSLLFYPSVTWETVIFTYSMGLPFDLIHAVSTVFFLWFIAEPMIEKLERIKIKYNIL